MKCFLGLDPILAVRDSVRHQSGEWVFTAVGSGVTNYLANVNWGALISILAVAASFFGGAAISLWKQWRVAQIEIDDAERKAADSRRSSIVPTPPFGLVPDRRPSG